MTTQFSAPNPLNEELRLVLAALTDLAGGMPPAGPLERHRVDLKEEPGRRGPKGELQPGGPENDHAARMLAEEASCMANTPGGGALVVGVADDGRLLGTELDTEWLRRRVYELTDRKLTVDAEAIIVADVRLVVLRMIEALEPIRFANRIKWRVDDRCVEIDATTWHARHLNRIGFDWSAQSSPSLPPEARATALQVARDYLRASNEPKALDLAAAGDGDLLRRLNVVNPDGHLSNAGALAFVGRTVPALDYLRRDRPGGDSRARVNEAGRALLEELNEIERTIAAFNPTEHIGLGMVVGQLAQLDPATAREAIVNGLAHRDWNTALPTVVEHVGASLVVTSPGGFVAGINPSNIITHPSQSRNPALTILLASLRVAEREGIGVDRMVRQMIRVGLEPPIIEEVSGPMVRTALVGGAADRAWLAFLAALTPDGVADDLDVLLLLRHLITHGWVDAATAAPILQRSTAEATAAIGRLDEARILSPGLQTLARLSATSTRQGVGRRVIERVLGTPADAPEAWCWTSAALEQLRERKTTITSVAARRRIAAEFAARRGRISTTELASITDVTVQGANRTMKELEEQGILAPGRAERAGRGFFYVPTTPAPT